MDIHMHVTLDKWKENEARHKPRRKMVLREAEAWIICAHASIHLYTVLLLLQYDMKSKVNSIKWMTKVTPHRLVAKSFL